MLIMPCTVLHCLTCPALTSQEKGAAAAHGGFKNTARIDRYDVNDERSLAEHKKADQAAAAATAMRDDQPFAVVGQAREKINAVIPLFLHEVGD